MVKIGNQIWMAENLNYEYNGNEESWCPNHSLSGCNTYGHLYTWEAANKVCPEGWHLPSKEVFEVLLKFASTDTKTDDDDGVFWLEAGSALKSANEADWSNTIGASDKDPGIGSYGNGLDTYGFAILPAGQYDSMNMNFGAQKRYATFWSSTEVEDFMAYTPIAYFNHNYIYGGINDIDLGFSVRCILTEE